MAEKYSKMKTYDEAVSSKKRKELLFQQLEDERASRIPVYKDIADNILPWRPRFNLNQTGKGERVNKQIYDGTGTLAWRTARAGLMGGITSPSRPWFRLTTSDPDLADYGDVKQWLYLVNERMSDVFTRSNLYKTLPQLYGDILGFTTGAMMIEEDFDFVMHCLSFPVGSYSIASDKKGRIVVFARQFRLTVRQLIEKFGMKDGSREIDWEPFSDTVKDLWNEGRTEEYIDVKHLIEPNENYVPGSTNKKELEFSSCYWESTQTSTSGRTVYESTQADNGKYLRESGYSYFPVLVARWETVGEEAWGVTCPALDALGDIRGAQLLMKRGAQALEKMINPAMVGHTSLKNSKTTLVAGDTTWVDEREGQKMFRPAHEVNVPMASLREEKLDLRHRISRAFYEDLFLMFANRDTAEPPTAREVSVRQEEKLLALGPVLQQLDQDVLSKLIDIAFMFMERQGMIPEPPQVLQGVPLKVEYISIMAQAQKLIGIQSTERFTSFVVETSVRLPDILDKVNVDELLNQYADQLSVPPKVVRPDEEAQAVRAQRAQQAAAMNAAETAKQASGAAKDLSQSDVGGGENALQAFINQANAGSLTQ